jgi:hypothetical protein
VQILENPFLGIAMLGSPHLWKHFVSLLLNPARLTSEQVSALYASNEQIQVSLILLQAGSRVCIFDKQNQFHDNAPIVFI